MGLDVGEKRLGMALSDPEGILAISLTVLERRGDASDIDRVLALARENEVGRIVVGLPRSLDGSLGPQARTTQAFIQELARRSEIPVVSWDERFSTVAAEKMLRAAGVKSRKRKEHRDAVAAALILQAFLDSQQRHFPESPGHD